MSCFDILPKIVLAWLFWTIYVDKIIPFMDTVVVVLLLIALRYLNGKKGVVIVMLEIVPFQYDW